MAVVLVGVAAATVSFHLTARKIVIGFLVVAAAGGMVAKSWKTIHARFKETTVAKELNQRSMGRGYYLRMARAISEDRWLGVGLNNWSYWVSNDYGPRQGYRFVPYKGTDKDPSTVVPPDSNVDMAQAAPAHSLGALTLGELGMPGLLLFTVVWLRWFQMGGSFLRKRLPQPMRRIGVGLFFALVGIFLHSLTEWVFRQSPIYYTIHILLGALASLYYVKRREKRAAALAPESALSEGYAHGSAAAFFPVPEPSGGGTVFPLPFGIGEGQDEGFVFSSGSKMRDDSPEKSSPESDGEQPGLFT